MDILKFISNKSTQPFSILIILFLSIFIAFNSFSHPGMYRTHDGDYHLIRSFHFFTELKSGQFPVRMTPEIPFSYGYLTFQFFYPLPYYVSAVFQILGFNTTLSWKLMQLLVIFVSLKIFYLWMKKHLNTIPALLATVSYGIVPFRFLTLYVTGQTGGSFGLLFAPLIGLGLFQLITAKDSMQDFTKSSTKLFILNKNCIPLSIGIAGIITSHLLSIIIFFIPLSVYALYLLNKNFSKQKVLALLSSTIFGILLSAFYFFPFMLEKSWVKIGNEVLIDYTDHWSTVKQIIYSAWGYGSSTSFKTDDISFQVGLAILISSLISFILIFQKKKRNETKLLAIFTIIFVILIFLMTQYSKSIWILIFPLQLIQFPWRLLAATSLVGSIIIGLVSQMLTGKQRLIFISLILLIMFYNVRNYTKPWSLDWKQDLDYTQDLKFYNGPTDISWELMPISATKIPVLPGPVILNATGSSVIVNHTSKPTIGNVKKVVNLTLSEPLKINLAIWDLPVWAVAVDDVITQKEIADDGTILVPVDEGEHTIKLILQKTNIQKVSDLISLISILFLVSFIAFPHSQKSAVK